MTSFWSDNKSEPKRSYRWIAFIDFKKENKSLFTIPSYLVTKFTKPKIVIDNEKIVNNYTSESIVVPKNYNWQDISITMADLENENGNVTLFLYEWLRKNGYLEGQTRDVNTHLFNNLDGSQIYIKLSQIDSNGNEIEYWDFVNPTIKTIDFGGEMTYEKDSFNQVTVEISYEHAKYTIKDPNFYQRHYYSNTD